MSSHRARKPTAHGRFVVLRGGLDLAGSSASNAATRQDELDWASFAERIGFQEPDALPEDYEDRLAERIFGAEAHASDWAEAVPASGIRPVGRSLSRGRVMTGILLAAAAVLIAWTSAGSSSRVASPGAPTRDASSPAVHAIDATSTPEPLTPPVEECRSVERAPEPERAHDPDPGVRLAKHLERNKKKRGGHATPVAASIPRNLTGDSAAPAPEEPASFVEEVIAVASALPRSGAADAAPPQLVASVQHETAELFDSRASNELDWSASSLRAARPWALAPEGERWLGVSAQPSDVNSPRAIAVTAQLDVTRAFASF